MTDFPEANTFDDEYVENTDWADAQEAFLAATKQFPGGLGVLKLTISGGVVLPTRGAHWIEVQTGFADDLTHIQYTNMRDGALIILWPNPDDATKLVTLKHASGGVGQMYLLGEADWEMTTPTMFQRRETVWHEVMRPPDIAHEVEQDAKIAALEWFVRALAGDGDGVFAHATAGLVGLKVSATSPQSMRVTIAAGSAFVNGTPIRIATATTSALMVAPTGSDRIDTVALDDTGSITIKTGTESGSPTAPAVDADEIKLAEIHHQVTESSIYDASNPLNGHIVDSRTMLNA